MSFIEAVLALAVLLDSVKGLIMHRIGIPMKAPELQLQPEPEGGIQLSEDMQQVLSLLTGFSKNRRIVLQSAPVGALRTTSARVQDVKHFTAVGANDTQNGPDKACAECICMGHPDNAAKVWVRTLSTAELTNSWPLGAGEVQSFSLDNMRDLQMLIVGDGEKLIVAYA